MYRCFADLGVWPPHTVVKVDDTGVGLQEGLNAGTWAVGLAISGNSVGLTLAEWTALDEAQQLALREIAGAQDDADSKLSELAGGFESDAAVGAGDERNLSLRVRMVIHSVNGLGICRRRR